MISPTNAFTPYIDGPGLSVTVSSGVVILTSGAPTLVALTAVSLTANTTNYVSLSFVTGAISNSTSPFAAGVYPIATVVTDNVGVKTLTDSRPDVATFTVAAGGSTGTGSVVLAEGATIGDTTPAVAITATTINAVTANVSGSVLTNPTITSATPAATKVIDSEVTCSASSISGGNVIAPVYGHLTIAASTGAFLAGVEGKLSITGTLNDATSAYQAALVGKLDLASCTGLTAGNLAMLWLDTGDNAPNAANLGIISAIVITNTGNNTNPNMDSLLRADAKANFVMDLNDNNGPNFTSTAAIGTYKAKLKVQVGCEGNGLTGTYYIPLYQ